MEKLTEQKNLENLDASNMDIHDGQGHGAHDHPAGGNHDPRGGTQDNVSTYDDISEPEDEGASTSKRSKLDSRERHRLVWFIFPLTLAPSLVYS
mgnify:CR=1 FL=1